jgi:hypothetical protein
MANGLLDRRKMRPEPLRPEVQLGPAFGVRKGVNERVMHGFCNATWRANLNLACGSVGWGSGCCIQALEAVWRSNVWRKRPS